MAVNILIAGWRLVHMTSTLLVLMVSEAVLSGRSEVFFDLQRGWWLPLICGAAYAALMSFYDRRAKP
jgi:hypothetical protein